jgi:hypothetical protein
VFVKYIILVVYYRRIGHGGLRSTCEHLCIYCTSVYLSKFHVLALPNFKKNGCFVSHLLLMLCFHWPWVYYYITLCWTKVFLRFVAKLGTKYKLITLPLIFTSKGQQERICSHSITKNPMGGCQTRMPFWPNPKILYSWETQRYYIYQERHEHTFLTKRHA